ncbi:HD-GYP domain-containing protein [Herbaspirillum sp. DW155]|uniref:HD-GYP domain-containing protein n=1 Tax=Herbaspirillum sp. DW155 TaxID=3095609 RepID=UPI00308DF6FC|nr:HD-GYP domain-containing protein [Herbaspirillum sp. DW155]
MSERKKIAVEQLAVGMYFCGFDASWINSPFWRTGFKLSSPSDVAEVVGAGYDTCWIDIALGDDLAGPSDLIPLIETRNDDAKRAQQVPAAWQDAQRLFAETKELAKELFCQVRLGKAVDVRICQRIVEDLTAAAIRDPDTIMSVLRLKLADEYVYAHSLSVSVLMVALGRTIGLDADACMEAGLAGYLHDIGKAFIPEDILNKPEQLTREEYKLVQRHTTLGYRYLQENPRIPPTVALVCLHHHEKMDGSGYPLRKLSNEIDLYSRMAAIADVYDALTSDRPYKQGWEPATAISRMACWKGHFDPTLMSAFVKSIGIYPVGSVVKMRSGRYAVVIRQNHDELLRPVVRIVEYAAATEMTEPVLIDLSDRNSGDEIAEKIDEHWNDVKGIAKSMLLSI